MYDDTDRLNGFTEHAVKVLKLAEVERQRLQDDYIGTEHLLVGLVAEKQGLAAKVLNDFGVDLHRVRYQIVFMTGRSNYRVVDTNGLSLLAKTMLACAASEARRLNDHSIGTGHLLTGLVRSGEGVAIEVLESLGVDREHIRRQTLQLLSRMERSYTNPLSFAQRSKRNMMARFRVPHPRLVPLPAN